MAELLNKDPKVYEEEYVNFMKDLKSFHENRGTAFYKLPKINGREIDLYLLYSLVTQHGGWEKVNLNGDWELLLPYFGLHRNCCNGPVALKQVYIRFLDVYERIHFLGEEVDRRESELHEEDDTRSRRKALRALHALPITYNASQHHIPDAVRGGGGYSTDLFTPPPVERIFQSLICPLPNEQDFAINVCTLLAMENRRPLDLSRYPKIVDALVAHAGISTQKSLKDLMEETYSQTRNQETSAFWQDVVLDKDIVQLASDEFLAAAEELNAVPAISRNPPAEPENEVNDVSMAAEETTVTLPSSPIAADEEPGKEVLTTTDEAPVPVLPETVETVDQEPADPSTEAAGGDPGPSGTVVGPPDPGTEKRAKNKLPPAVLKPDNPRAARYWQSLKREAVAKYFGPKPDLQTKRSKLDAERDVDEDEDLFQLNRDLGTLDPYGQRVMQIISIIRNLSFDEMNASVLAQNEACLRFLLLCAHAKWSNLSQLAMDTISNLANEVKLEEPSDSPLSAILLGTVSRCVQSDDRFMVMSSLEILNKLSQKDENESLLTAALDDQVYSRICSYLTVPDVALLIYTLECIYAMTSLGQTFCNGFLHCPGSLESLISLLTVEAQSFGPKACILMRVVETVAETDTMPASSHTPLVNVAPQYAIAAAAAPRLVAHSPAPSAPATPPPAALAPATPQIILPTAAAVAVTPAAKNANKATVSRPGTPTSAKASSTSLTFPEKEQAAVQWLKSAYEPVVGAPSVEQSVLYKQYVTACGKLSGPRQVLAAGQFYNCVRSAFGANVGPFRKQINSGVEFYFEGISAKPLTATSGSPTPEVPSSPILKAQLSAPPKATRKEPIKQSSSHPHLSQALSGPSPEAGSSAVAPPSSSLIKSLLANKVPETLPRAGHGVTGLSPAATNLPGMNRNNTNSMSMPTVVVVLQSEAETEVAQRQKLQQQTQQPNGPIKPAKDIKVEPGSTKVNGTSSPAGESESLEFESKGTNKGMLADLLERDVKKETINGSAALHNKEIRISEKGLEVVQKDVDNKSFAVDMGVVGMDLGVDLGDGVGVPKSAHMIAQVNDAGHVEIHLEEEPDSTLCNGQSLLDALESKMGEEVSSSSDVVPAKAVKRPADPSPDPEVPAKKSTSSPALSPSGSILEKAIELTFTEETKEPTSAAATPQTNGIATSAVIAATPQQQTYVLAQNPPRAFLIVQQQNPRMPMAPQGQRFLLAIPRPGGGMVPASVVAISSNQVQATSNGPCSIATVVASSNQGTEGLVTFSGGAVAFPARSTEAATTNPVSQSITITPVPGATTTAITTVEATTTTTVAKKRNNSSGSESGSGNKARCRPQKNKSTDTQAPTTAAASAATTTTTTTATTGTTPSAIVAASTSPLPEGALIYLCEWGGCMKTFKSPQEVYHHACHTHCPITVDELPCLWERCDGLKRRRFSMMTHLMDRHCNEEVQRLMAVRRHQLSLQGKTDIPAPPLPPPHPGYAPHAALQAIKRHAADLMNHKELSDEKEGPVTKSIRLTSALILRNFATYSSLGRRLMRRHESLLAGVALSNVESSRTVSQILFELANQGS